MNDVLYLMVACLAGMLLGGVFFGGLWWTVGKCLRTPHPAQWMLASGLFRMSVTLTGFYLVSAGQWQRLLACLVGFITARLVVTWLTGHRRITVVVDEASHAS
jgi:F1F0 ATPase subunit 2